MSSATNQKEISRMRKSIYFDCICGASSSIISISAMIFFSVTEGIRNLQFYFIGMAFWIIWLILSLSLISFGLYSYYLEKKYPEGLRTRKKVEPPII
jgi:hypothetical protein